MRHFKVVPLLPGVAELQGHKQLLAHGPALARPLSWESTRAHPAATGIWGDLRSSLGSSGTPGLAKSWREGGGHGAAFFMGERSGKGLSLFLCTLVST